MTAWLPSHREGWTSDLNSYFPETVVENDFIRLDLHESRLILSLKTGARWPQYSRAAEPVHLKWKSEIEKRCAPPRPKSTAP